MKSGNQFLAGGPTRKSPSLQDLTLFPCGLFCLLNSYSKVPKEDESAVPSSERGGWTANAKTAGRWQGKEESSAGPALCLTLEKKRL
jgi:hypothetical protein